MNLNRYLIEANRKGLKQFQVYLLTKKEKTIKVTNNVIEQQQIGVTTNILGKGIYKDKIGYFQTNAIDKNTPSIVVDNIIKSAKNGEKSNILNYCGDSKKRNANESKFKESTLIELKEFALKVSNQVKKRDNRIKKVHIVLSMYRIERHIKNSFGLNVEDYINMYKGNIKIIAMDKKGIVVNGINSFYCMSSLEDLEEKIYDASNNALKESVNYFNQIAIETGTYKAILSPKVASLFLSSLMPNFDARKIANNTSAIGNVKGKKITNECLTIRNTPFVPCPSMCSFDIDGVPCCNFEIIENGILKNHFYSFSQAIKENKIPNGCGKDNGVSNYITLTVESSEYELEELFKIIKNGIYIESIEGFEHGMNQISLDYSFPCNGYIIKNSKIAGGFIGAIVTGNLKETLCDIRNVGNNTEYNNGVFSPSLLIDRMMIVSKKVFDYA